MNKINRYIFYELFLVFVIAILATTGALFLDKLLYLTEVIINKGVSFYNVTKMVIYIAPAFLVLTIPIGVLIASVVTFSRISADSEMTALKAGGISLYQLLVPVMALSLLAFILTEFMMIYGMPNGNQAFRELLFRILRTQANYEIKSKLFNNDFKNMVIYVDKKDENSPLMKGIFISETTKDNEYRIINAEKGSFISDKNAFVVQMNLTNGTIHRLGKDKNNYHTLKFKRYILEMEIPKPEEIGGKLLRGNRELSIAKLKEKIERHKKDGITFYSELVELHKKFSIPFAALIFGLIGAPLGVKCSRSGKSGSFTISLFVIVFYYILLLFGESLGDTGNLHPFLAMWLPNFVVIIIAGYLVYKTANEFPFKYWQYALDKFVDSYYYVKRFLISDIRLKKSLFFFLLVADNLI